MPGLVPGIYALLAARKAWMAGTSPAMTLLLLGCLSRMETCMKYDTNFKSVKDQVSAEEWQARVELAACYRLVDQYEMTDLIYNHITSRIPGTDHLLINLY